MPSVKKQEDLAQKTILQEKQPEPTQERSAEKEEQEKSEEEQTETSTLTTGALVGAGAAALASAVDQPVSSTKKAQQSSQPTKYQPQQLSIATTEQSPTPSTTTELSAIDSLYSNLYEQAEKNRLLFYHTFKNPTKSLTSLQDLKVQNELTSLAFNDKTVIYLSSTIVQAVTTQLGFTATPQPQEQWELSSPSGAIVVDFLSEQIARISLPTQFLVNTIDPQLLKSLFLQKLDVPPVQQLPTILFDLPVQKTVALTIGSTSIMAVKPPQTENVITKLFFELLEKGQAKEKKKGKKATPKIETVSMPAGSTKAGQKISPTTTMRKIVGLPEAPVKNPLPTKFFNKKNKNIQIPESFGIPLKNPNPAQVLQRRFFISTPSGLPRTPKNASSISPRIPQQKPVRMPATILKLPL